LLSVKSIAALALWLCAPLSLAATQFDLGLDASYLDNANDAPIKADAGNTTLYRSFARVNYHKPLAAGVLLRASLGASDVNYEKPRYKDYWSASAGFALAKKFTGFNAPLFSAALNISQRQYDNSRYEDSHSYRAKIKFDTRITDRLRSHVGASYRYSENLASRYAYISPVHENGNSVSFDLGVEHSLSAGSVYSELSVELHDHISSQINSNGVMVGQFWRDVRSYNAKLGYNLPLSDALAADLLVSHAQRKLNAQLDYSTTSASLALIYRFSH